MVVSEIGVMNRKRCGFSNVPTISVSRIKKDSNLVEKPTSRL